MKKFIVMLLICQSLCIAADEYQYIMKQGDKESGIFNVEIRETAQGHSSIMWNGEAVFKFIISIPYSFSGNAAYTSEGKLIEGFVKMNAEAWGFRHQLRIQDIEGKYTVWKRKDETKDWKLRKHKNFEDLTLGCLFPSVNKKIIQQGAHTRTYIFYDVEMDKVREIELTGEYYNSPDFGQVYRLYNKTMEYHMNPETGVLLYNYIKAMGLETSMILIE